MEPLPVSKVPSNVERVRNDDEVESFKHCVNEASHQVIKLERQIQEIEQFYSSNRKKKLIDAKNNSWRIKDKDRHATLSQNEQDGKAASKRMHDLVNQFNTILNQITKRKGVCLSLDSADVDDQGLHGSADVDDQGLHGSADVDDQGLHGSCEGLGEPRDLNSIKMRMKATDGNGYKHVRHIYTDVRQVLRNAIEYNDKRSDAHVTAKTLFAKFREKWLLLFPEIMEEDKIIEEEGGLKQAYHAQMAKEVSSELYKVDVYLKELREVVLRRCRRMSTREKRELGRALTKLTAEDLKKALEIIAEGNPTFQATAEEVDLDIDAQSESTLWRLKYFVFEILQVQGQEEDRGKQSTSTGGDKNDEKKDDTAANTSKSCKSKCKRKTGSPDAVV